MIININTNKQEFETGRVYNGPQVLEYRVVSIQPCNDDILENVFDLVIWMRDKSRNLGYELKFYFRDSLPTGERILSAYDEGGNRELTVTDEEKIDDNWSDPADDADADAAEQWAEEQFDAGAQ